MSLECLKRAKSKTYIRLNMSRSYDVECGAVVKVQIEQLTMKKGTRTRWEGDGSMVLSSHRRSCGPVLDGVDYQITSFQANAHLDHIGIPSYSRTSVRNDRVAGLNCVSPRGCVVLGGEAKFTPGSKRAKQLSFLRS